MTERIPASEAAGPPAKRPRFEIVEVTPEQREHDEARFAACLEAARADSEAHAGHDHWEQASYPHGLEEVVLRDGEPVVIPARPLRELSPDAPDSAE